MQIYYYNIRSSSLILFVIVLFLTEYFVYRFIITISRSGLIFAAIDSFMKELFFMDFHQFHFFFCCFLSFCSQGFLPFILLTGIVSFHFVYRGCTYSNEILYTDFIKIYLGLVRFLVRSSNFDRGMLLGLRTIAIICTSHSFFSKRCLRERRGGASSLVLKPF